MNVSEMRLHFFDRFAVQGDEQMQHTMGCGVLRSHIDHKVTFYAW
jgi:hypothetical protein